MSEMRQNSLSPSGLTLCPGANGGFLRDVPLLLNSHYGPSITLCSLDPAPRILNHGQSSNPAPQYLCCGAKNFISHTRREKKKKLFSSRGKREENRTRCQTAERGIVNKSIILELFPFFFLPSRSPQPHHHNKYWFVSYSFIII